MEDKEFIEEFRRVLYTALLRELAGRVAANDFIEAEHPRDKIGRFTRKGSGQFALKATKRSVRFLKNFGKVKDPKTIAGVKKGKPMSFKQANGGRVNPHYNGGNNGYSFNCQTCVAVFEARLRGYEIEAVPYDSNNEAMQQIGFNPWKAYKDPKTGKSPDISHINAKTYKECKEFLKNKIKRGERYAFGYRPGLTTNNHIIEVCKGLTGELKFYDPQNGEHLKSDNVLREAYFWRRIGREAGHFKPIIFRVDDKDLDTELLNKVLTPTKEIKLD